MAVNERRSRACDEAIEWWIELEAARMSRETRSQFIAWLRESPVHVSEMLHMWQLHSTLKEFRGWEQISTENGEKADDLVVAFERAATDSRASITEPRVVPTVPSRRRPYWWLGAAAAAVAGVVVWVSTISQYEVVQTTRGERRGVMLADGSLIQIDPESQVRIHFERNTRDVRLMQGRAVFHVAKDPGRPFLVHAGATMVRAVGTEFGVERSREGVIVTVVSGKVAVLQQDETVLGDHSGAGLSTTVGAGRQSQGRNRIGGSHREGTAEGDPGAASLQDLEVFLTAGQQVTVPRGGVAEPVKLVDSGSALAWADGRLIFENSTVADVVENFNRYNLLQLHVGDRELGKRLVNGVFDANEPDSFISVIQTLAPVRVERQGNNVTLYSAP